MVNHNQQKSTNPWIGGCWISVGCDWPYSALVYRRESNLAISSSPLTNNNVQFLLRRTAIVWNIKKVLAVRRVWAWSWWPLVSVVLTVRFPITWFGNVWEPSPPPRSTGLSRLFNPPFPGLTLRYQYVVTWTCDWHAWFSLLYDLITIDTTPFCNCKFGA